MVSGLLLNRVLTLHVQLFGHLIAIIGKQIVVQGLIIASNTTAYACGMSSEDGSNLWIMLLDIK